MDFEQIDSVLGDTLGKGDIVVSGIDEYHQIISLEDDDPHVVLYTYNLSTGDEDTVFVDPSDSIKIFRSY